MCVRYPTLVLGFLLLLFAGLTLAVEPKAGKPSSSSSKRRKAQQELADKVRAAESTGAKRADTSEPVAAVPAGESELSVGEPVTQRNLTIFPVVSKTARGQVRFITLDEGLESGSLEIVETGPVNEVNITNRGDKPLYLMPGEIIIGGKQDRTIARETVIPPNRKATRVAVFCVEQGRWSSRDRQQQASYVAEARGNTARAGSVALSGGGGAASSLQGGETDGGKFVGSVGSLNKSSRLAVQKSADQQKVWAEVGKENAKSKVRSSSGAFTGNYAEVAAVKRLDTYLENLQQPVAERGNIVGAIVAVNGKVESVDVFESTPLFRKLWPKLLKSYALDAANAPPAGENAKVCTRDEATTFFREVERTSATASAGKDGLAVAQGESERVLLFSAHESHDPLPALAQSAPRGGAGPRGSVPRSGGYREYGGAMGGGVGGMGGGFGGGVHGSAFAK